MSESRREAISRVGGAACHADGARARLTEVIGGRHDDAVGPICEVEGVGDGVVDLLTVVAATPLRRTAGV